MSWEDRSGRIDLYGGGLVWRQVAADIEGDIKSGRLEARAKLPGEQEMASIYGVARVTIRRAIEDLRERGLVTTAHGRGTFVRPDPGREA